MKFWRVMAVMVMLAGAGLAQTQTKRKAAPKSPAAVWSQDVMRAFGVLPSQFAASGLGKLTQDQLNTLLAAALKPKGTTLACPAPAPGQTRLLLTVSGGDATPAIADQIRQAMSSVAGVQLVDAPAQADATLRVVVQALTVNQKTIGYTASYVVGTPCTENAAGKTTDVELKGVLGSSMNARIAGLAQDLAASAGKELRTAPAAQ